MARNNEQILATFFTCFGNQDVVEVFQNLMKGVELLPGNGSHEKKPIDNNYNVILKYISTAQNAKKA